MVMLSAIFWGGIKKSAFMFIFHCLSVVLIDAIMLSVTIACLYAEFYAKYDYVQCCHAGYHYDEYYAEHHYAEYYYDLSLIHI